MSGATPQTSSRRGRAGRHRSANFSRGKDGATNKLGSTAKQSDRSSEPSGKPEGQKPAKPKAQNDGEKLVVRRLPPGMTEEEFATILGPEWEVGKGKVDWFDFVPGGISKDLSKPSTPGRAYFHLVRKDDIMPLNEAVRSKTWEDAKNTFTNPSLIGPPTVEFCLYKKVPGAKKRVDSRQGTIDQDPEFQAFLESLANPIQTKDVETEFEESEKADAKVTTTPLVEFLKEKKAKSKENSKKSAKGDGKGKGASKDDDQPAKKKGKVNKDDKAEATKEPVKILTKNAASEQAAEVAKAAASRINGAGSNEGPKSRRAGIAAAARLLQRDLGLSPGSAHRRARQEAAKVDGGPKTDSKSELGDSGTGTGAKATAANRPASPAASESSVSKNSGPTGGKSQQSRKNRGAKGKATEAQATLTPTNPPVILKKRPDGEAAPTESQPETPIDKPHVSSKAVAQAPKANSSKGSQQRKTAPTAQESTRAFVKHANPSQGVTDSALKQCLEVFGPVTFVEIDKRKGFAYVDFADHDSLVKAIAGSPVPVGQGTVQVLERKEKKAQNQPQATPTAEGSAPKPDKPQGRGRRGRGGGGGGNKGAANEKTAPATGDAPSTATPTGNGG